MLRVRFRNFPEDIARLWFKELIFKATGEETLEVKSEDVQVDLEITGPYNNASDLYQTPFIKRVQRLGYITLTKGAHLSKPRLAAGIQPLKTAKKSIWFTGENERPPQGLWDAYFSFDYNMVGERVVYFPLWMLTSTNMLKSTSLTFWNQQVPTLEELRSKRNMKRVKSKFTVALIGKTYPLRLHAIEELTKIGKVDVFGTSVRKVKSNPGRIVSRYKFCLCFENDVYPGYVTEKPFEAYIAGTIPLYYGSDPAKYLNPKAVINLMDFKNITEWASYIKEVNEDKELYRYHFEQPILLKKPTLDPIVKKLRDLICY